MGVSDSTHSRDQEDVHTQDGNTDGRAGETTPAPQVESGVVEPDAPPEPDLSLDLVFEILKNERRRFVLQYMVDRDEQVALGTLAEHIAARENDTTPDQLTSQERKRVYVGLYQCHLPKMDSANIVDFDKDRGTIALGPNAGELYPYLDTSADDERTWRGYYLGVAGLGTLLLGFGLATTVVPAAAAAVVTVVGVVAVAVLESSGWDPRKDGYRGSRSP